MISSSKPSTVAFSRAVVEVIDGGNVFVRLVARKEVSVADGN
ncbi:hypothetical protein LCGC14_3141470, partial [marine sediment metagenome]